jgi:voltage-gated potassium channel
MANENPTDDETGKNVGLEGKSFRERIWRIIFLSDTPVGKAFDVTLLLLISISVLVVMIESVDEIRERHGSWLYGIEWGVTVLFTIEYFVRLSVARNRRKYAFSFFGIVDLLAILPTYLELVLSGSHYLMMLRVMRLLRMFRVFKMARYLGEASLLINALKASRPKIAVFLFSVLAMISVEGTLMYLLEHSVNEGFSNIPKSIYWGIVTITTVGYGDVVPVTVLGKVLACIVTLTGFAIIAVPTGIVTAELGREIAAGRLDGRACDECGWKGHDLRARHCLQCGAKLPGPAGPLRFPTGR